MEHVVGTAEAADAAAAFEALRREVALLNVAVAGLAAEQAPAPDYSETLGEIAKGVSVTVGRLGRLVASPALAMSPVEMARQIAAAGDEARRQDWAAVQQAQEALQRAVRDLDGWIDRARLASVQNWRLMQAAAFGVVGGVVLYASVPTIIVNAAPARWAWPEKRAARILGRDMWSAGERMLSVADPERWRQLSKPSRTSTYGDARVGRGPNRGNLPYQ